MNETAVTIAISVIASGGFWGFLQWGLNKLSNRDEHMREIVREETKDIRESLTRIDAVSAAVMGTKHRELVEECERYISQGYISAADLADLHEYTYDPYRALGGNGTGEKLMKEVEALPSIKQ